MRDTRASFSRVRQVWARTLPWRRRLYQWLGRLAAATVVRVSVEGRPPPPEGAYLLAANHLGHVDPWLVLTVLEEPPQIIALAELQRQWMAPFILFYHPIAVRRDEFDRDVLREALATLARGEPLLLFPEARISRTGALEEARDGVGYLALQAGVPVIPVAITGTEALWAAWRAFRRPHLTVRFGEAIRPEREPGLSRREQRARLTDLIMRRIAALLPDTYRGAYREAGSGR